MTLKYVAGDSVQCYWDSLKFQAKVMKVDACREATPYLIHYQGWKNRWDEWVEEKRLIGKGSAQKKTSKKTPKKAQEFYEEEPPGPGSSGVKEEEVEEEDDEPPPTLERIIDKGKVIYRTSEGKNLKSLTEMRRFCDKMGLLFDPTDYDFIPPPPPPTLAQKTKKQSTLADNRRNKSQQNKSPQRGGRAGERLVKNELASDLREIKRAMGGGRRQHQQPQEQFEDPIEMEVSYELTEEQVDTANLFEEGQQSVHSPHKLGRPSRSRKPNQRYSDLVLESHADTRRRQNSQGGMEEERHEEMKKQGPLSPSGGKRGRGATRGKNTGLIKVKTTPRKGKRRREEEEAEEEEELLRNTEGIFPGNFDSPEEGGIRLADLLSAELPTEEGSGEFIEIQEPLEVEDDQFSHPPTLPLQEQPKKGRQRKKSPAKHQRNSPHHHYRQSEKEESYHAQQMGYPGLNMGLEDYNLEHSFLNHPQHPVHQQQHPQATQRLASGPIQGIKVTSDAPTSDAPSRILMKLRAPESKKGLLSSSIGAGTGGGRFKASLRVGPDGMEYLEGNYAPSIHTGGRGRFGVIGSGPPPAPIIAERPEDFCHLPPQVVGDHCYGKTPPASAPGSTVTISSTPESVSHYGGGKVSQQFLPSAGRIHLSGLGGSRTIRLIQSPSYMHSTSQPANTQQPNPRPAYISLSQHGGGDGVGGNEASAAAAHLHASNAGSFEDAYGGGGIAPPELEGYTFVGEDMETSGSGGGSGLASTVTLMTHGHHSSMLGDKLPANILEGVEDNELGVDQLHS